MFYDHRHKWVPCTCPVCGSVLGYKDTKDLVHYYCGDCDWTFRFNRIGQVLSRHRGRMQWDDYPPYLKDSISEENEAPS